MNQATLGEGLYEWQPADCAIRRRTQLHQIAVASLAIAALSVRPAQADPIDDIVLEQMAASHLPGVAVAVIDKGRITKLASYGQANIEWSQQVDPDTRFQLASATKPFTAIVLMRQIEQGHLQLDDPIAKFFSSAPDSWSRITVRQLANHNSGLSENLGKPSPTTVDEAVAASMRQPLAYEPGTDSRYGFSKAAAMPGTSLAVRAVASRP